MTQCQKKHRVVSYNVLATSGLLTLYVALVRGSELGGQ